MSYYLEKEADRIAASVGLNVLKAQKKSRVDPRFRELAKAAKVVCEFCLSGVDSSNGVKFVRSVYNLRDVLNICGYKVLDDACRNEKKS